MNNVSRCPPKLETESQCIPCGPTIELSSTVSVRGFYEVFVLGVPSPFLEFRVLLCWSPNIEKANQNRVLAARAFGRGGKGPVLVGVLSI